MTGEGSFHYPAIIQSRDSRLHVSFTNNRVWIDHIALSVDWIMSAGEDLPVWADSRKERL